MLIKKLFNSGTTIAAWVGLLISIMPYVIDLFHSKIAKLIVTPIIVDFNKLNFAISNLGNLPGILEKVEVEVEKNNGLLNTYYPNQKGYKVLMPNETNNYEYSFDAAMGMILPTSIPPLLAFYDNKRHQFIGENKCFIKIEYRDIFHPVIFSRTAYPC